MPLGGKDDDYSASVTSFLKVLSSAGLIWCLKTCRSATIGEVVRNKAGPWVRKSLTVESVEISILLVLSKFIVITGWTRWPWIENAKLNGSHE